MKRARTLAVLARKESWKMRGRSDGLARKSGRLSEDFGDVGDWGEAFAESVAVEGTGFDVDDFGAVELERRLSRIRAILNGSGESSAQFGEECGGRELGLVGADEPSFVEGGIADGDFTGAEKFGEFRAEALGRQRERESAVGARLDGQGGPHGAVFAAAGGVAVEAGGSFAEEAFGLALRPEAEFRLNPRRSEAEALREVGEVLAGPAALCGGQLEEDNDQHSEADEDQQGGKRGGHGRDGGEAGGRTKEKSRMRGHPAEGEERRRDGRATSVS